MERVEDRGRSQGHAALRRCLDQQLHIWDERAGREAAIHDIAGYPLSGYAGRAGDVISKLEARAEHRMLDAGAGPGALAGEMAQRGFERVTALDLSLANLQHLPPTDPSVLAVQGSIHMLPFRDGSFDRVVCYGVLHYFPSWADAMGVVHELVRVCRLGGRVLIADNEPLVNHAFEPPIVKHPINVVEYDPGRTYLCFDVGFFEALAATMGSGISVYETWRSPGHFDVVVTV